MRLGHIFSTTALLTITALSGSAQAEKLEEKATKYCNVNVLSKSVQTASKELQQTRDFYKVNLRAQLQLLKKKKGWNQDEFERNALPLIQNKELSAFDRNNIILIDAISNLNPTQQKITADCQLLVQLNSKLRKIIENTKRKWDCMLLQIKKASISSN